MDRLINENAVLSAIGEWIAHNEHTYTNATEYLRNRIKAIKTAEQESTAKENLVVGDCISRQAVDRLAMRYLREPTDKHVAFYEEFIELPPVTPKPKTGHWIATEKDWWKCSECGRKIFSESEVDRKEFQAWCGRCGAKMLPADSDKEG